MSSATKLLSGTVTKQVNCAGCGRGYEYDLSRTVIGNSAKGVATKPEAEAQALQDAEAKLKTALAHDCDLVPCPSCKAITQEMKTYRWKRFGAAFACMGVGAGILLVVFLVMLATQRILIIATVLGGVCILLGLAILAIGIKETLAPKRGRL